MISDDIEYEADGRTMIGRLAAPSDSTPRPAVLVCHEGPGMSEHTYRVADRLAGLGYVTFALDYHGGGAFLPMEEAMGRLGELIADPDRTQSLAQAGLDVLLRHPSADRTRLAAIGYCFGGVMALELGRSGADVKAIVGFHPGFTSPRPDASRAIRGSVLMCCGSEDPFATAEQRVAFEADMREAAVADWRLELYGGVKHSFTNPDADTVGIPGIGYDAGADRRSWRSMLDLFDQTLGQPPV
jgi:dienelactone hydrolase